ERAQQAGGVRVLEGGVEVGLEDAPLEVDDPVDAQPPGVGFGDAGEDRHRADTDVGQRRMGPQPGAQGVGEPLGPFERVVHLPLRSRPRTAPRSFALSRPLSPSSTTIPSRGSSTTRWGSSPSGSNSGSYHTVTSSSSAIANARATRRIASETSLRLLRLSGMRNAIVTRPFTRPAAAGAALPRPTLRCRPGSPVRPVDYSP